MPTEDSLANPFGTMRCCDCGKLILASQGNQTNRRCIECWTDKNPLQTLEVMHGSVRVSEGVFNRRGPHSPPSPKNREDGALTRQARDAAQYRISLVFPDVYNMIHDEERAKRGLAPIVRSKPIDFDEVVTETLGFESVYDALDKEGVTDA